MSRGPELPGLGGGPNGGSGEMEAGRHGLQGASVGPRAQRARGGVYRPSQKHGVEVRGRTAGNNPGGRAPGPQVWGHGLAWQVGRGRDAGGQRLNRPRASGQAPVGQAWEPSTKEGCPQEV